jgi:hypothetical protein
MGLDALFEPRQRVALTQDAIGAALDGKIVTLARARQPDRHEARSGKGTWLMVFVSRAARPRAKSSGGDGRLRMTFST